MKMEKSGILNAGLSKEMLEQVSGGIDEEKIGPKNPQVLKAKSYIVESQNILSQAQIFAPELADTLARAYKALNSAVPVFNISEAYVMVQRSFPLIEILVKNENLNRLLRSNSCNAMKILETLV